MGVDYRRLERRNREKARLLREAGFEFYRMGKGSHMIYRHPKTGKRVVVSPGDNDRARQNFAAFLRQVTT